MAEMKLTKAEQQLKKTNPKKFAELMKRRQRSSARKLRLSQQKKAEDAGSRKTTPTGGIAAATLGAGPAAMGIVRLGSGLFKILNDKSNKIFKTVGEAQKAAKQRGKFKVGDKTYNSLAAANKARRAQKIEMKGTPPKPGKKGQTFNVKTKAPDKPNQQQLTGAAKRSKLEAAGRAADKMTKIARGKKITDSAKKAVGPAAVATTAAVAARPKKAAPKPAPKSASKPRSTVADVKKKPKPPSVKKQEPPKVKAKVSSGGRSKGRGGIDSGLLEFMKFAGGRDAFKPDAIDRGLASLGGGEVSGPMVKAEAAYLNSLYDKEQLGLDLTKQEQSFMDNFGKKKGGRLKKKKPVARKKAVTKKAPVRKKAVAKKPVARRRGAKRGFGVALRGY